MRISGLWRLVAIGRIRPKKPLPGGAAAASKAGLGALGKAARMAGLVVVTVFSVVPSKLSESSTTLLNASIVTSAKDAFTRVPLWISQVKPRRGCQLFLSDEQAGIIPLPWKQVPLGP